MGFLTWEIIQIVSQGVLFRCYFDDLIRGTLAAQNKYKSKSTGKRRRYMDIKLESRDGFMLATVTGRISLEKAINIFEKTCDAAVQRGFHKIVVDVLQVSGELSHLDLYELG